MHAHHIAHVQSGSHTQNEHLKQCITGVEGRETESNEMKISRNPCSVLFMNPLSMWMHGPYFYFLNFQKVRQLELKTPTLEMYILLFLKES